MSAAEYGLSPTPRVPNQTGPRSQYCIAYLIEGQGLVSPYAPQMGLDPVDTTVFHPATRCSHYGARIDKGMDRGIMNGTPSGRT
jgi:hypothetical protein